MYVCVKDSDDTVHSYFSQKQTIWGGDFRPVGQFIISCIPQNKSHSMMHDMSKNVSGHTKYTLGLTVLAHVLCYGL
jgi:hypothetical protein